MHRSKCCVPECNNRSGTRHRFPVYEENVFKIWVERIAHPIFSQLDDYGIYNSYVVCNNHFSQDCASPGTKRLKHYSLPTLYLPGMYLSYGN